MITDETVPDRRYVDRRASGITREWQETIEAQLEVNTKLTAQHAEDTREMVEFFRAAQQGFRVLGWIGKAVKYVAPIGAGFAALIAAYRQYKGA